MTEFPLPFDGAISRYFREEAPKSARKAIEAAGKDDILDASYPYREEMRKKDYEARMEALQIELVKLQADVKQTGKRLVVVFEGRDAAGKGGTIGRFREKLTPLQIWLIERIAGQVLERAGYERDQPRRGTPAWNAVFLSEWLRWQRGKLAQSTRRRLGLESKDPSLSRLAVGQSPAAPVNTRPPAEPKPASADSPKHADTP